MVHLYSGFIVDSIRGNSTDLLKKKFFFVIDLRLHNPVTVILKTIALYTLTMCIYLSKETLKSICRCVGIIS